VDFVLVKQRKTTIARIAVSAISSLRLLLYEGIQIGTTNTLIESAMSFLRNGFSPKDIAKGIKLPLADIEALQKNL
jgi:chaperonin GroEL (HSP60 family)